MAKPSVHSTFVIERAYPVPAQRLFEACARPELKRRWYAEGEGHALDTFEMDFRVGGIERLRYRLGDHTPLPGMQIEAETRILDLVPGERLVIAETMRLGEATISASLLTFEFGTQGSGSLLLCTHQGAFFEGADGPEIREMGWRVQFDRLGKLLS